MQADVQEAEKSVAAQIALEKKFKILFEEQEALVKNVKSKLIWLFKLIADLARRALEEKQNAEQKMNEYKASYEQNKAAADNLRLKLEEMRKQLNELKNKRETLVARVNAAKAQKNINQAMSGFDSNSAKAGLSRMEEKALQLEAEAEASGEVYKKEKSLDDEFASLNKNSAVDDELARIMKQYEK